MNALVFIGGWMICGCIVSLLVYLFDENKGSRNFIYFTNLYIFFIIIFWPVTIYLFLRFLCMVFVNRPNK